MNWESASIAAMALMIGLGAGIVHYRALHAVTQQFLDGKMRAAIAGQFMRLAVIGGVLVGTAWLGALPLLACFGGILLGRWIVLRKAREEA